MEITNSSDLTIRPFKASDAEDFLLYGGDEKVTHFTIYDTFKTKEEAASFIEQDCIPHPYCRSICLNDRSIGHLTIKPGIGVKRCRAEVWYMLAAKYWGQGIVANALRIAIVEAFKEFPDVLRMQAHVSVLNNASQRVLEKVGFHREALFRKFYLSHGKACDAIMFSLLSTDLILLV